MTIDRILHLGAVQVRSIRPASRTRSSRPRPTRRCTSHGCPAYREPRSTPTARRSPRSRAGSTSARRIARDFALLNRVLWWTIRGSNAPTRSAPPSASCRVRYGSGFTNPICHSRNEYRSAATLSVWSLVEPMPCPACVIDASSTGLPLDVAAWSRCRHLRGHPRRRHAGRWRRARA